MASDPQAGWQALEVRAGKWVVCAALVGLTAGAGVAALDRATAWLAATLAFDGAPALLVVGVPALALVASVLLARALTRDRSTDTTEAVLENFHAPAPLDGTSLPAKMAAAMLTVGGGGSAGLEGPAIYLGAVAGTHLQRPFARLFDAGEQKVMMIAGAAAGLAAIFRAPLTGVTFALEAPYLNDLVRHAVTPALVAASVSYVTFTSLVGTDVLLPAPQGAASYPPLHLLLAVLFGVVCALVAQGFVALTRAVDRFVGARSAWTAALVAGAIVGVSGVVARLLVGRTVTLGEGADGVQLFLGGTLAPGTIAALVLLKLVATVLTLRAGGVGGVFFPLAFLGAGLGALAHALFASGPPTLLPLVGVAAMLSAAYRAPLTGAAFVAETTGSAGYLIPALLAAAAADLCMGGLSFSRVQMQHHMAEEAPPRAAGAGAPNAAGDF